MNGYDFYGSKDCISGGIWTGIPLFWRFQIGGWIAYGLFSIPVKWSIFGSMVGVTVSLYREVLGFLLTLGMYLVYRRIYIHWNVFRIVLTIILLAFFGSCLELLLSYVLHNVVLFDEAGFGSDTNRVVALYYRTILFLGWSFLYFIFRLYFETRSLSERLACAVADNRDAEAQLLRSQVSPHFLFNALATIRGSSEQSPNDFPCIIQSLADYLVYSLDHSRDKLVTLGMEFDATCNYLQVEKSRFQEGIEIDCHIDEAARPFKVPGIILQPLVENAIKYGRETSEKPLRIRLNVLRLDRDTVQITVSNTGNWMQPQAREKSSHLGLSGLRRRLELLYADRHRIEFSDTGGRVTFIIHIPSL